MVARLERGVLAVPVHSAGADGYHRTPGSIAISSAVEVPNDVAAAIAAIPNISFASVFSTTSPPLVSCVCLNFLAEQLVVVIANHEGRANIFN